MSGVDDDDEVNSGSDVAESLEESSLVVAAVGVQIIVRGSSVIGTDQIFLLFLAATVAAGESNPAFGDIGDGSLIGVYTG